MQPVAIMVHTFVYLCKQPVNSVENSGRVPWMWCVMNPLRAANLDVSESYYRTASLLKLPKLKSPDRTLAQARCSRIRKSSLCVVVFEKFLFDHGGLRKSFGDAVGTQFKHGLRLDSTAEEREMKTFSSAHDCGCYQRSSS